MQDHAPRQKFLQRPTTMLVNVMIALTAGAIIGVVLNLNI